MALVVKEERRFVDRDTGEVVPVVAIIPEVRDGGFAKVYELFSYRVLEDLRELGGASGLLLLMVAQAVQVPVQSGGWFFLEVEEMARVLSVSRSTLFSYLRLLKRKGYVEQRRARQMMWRIRPELVFRGNLARYFEAKSRERGSEEVEEV